VLALTSGRSAEAAFGNVLPSTRWMIMGSPSAPEDYAECDSLREAFQAEISGLSAQHDSCLEGAPPDDAHGGSCTKLACQALHTARDAARRRSGEQQGICRQRVGEHLAEQREEERREREAAERAERAERERQQQEAEEAAEQAKRERAEQQRAAEEAQEEREEAARAAQEEQERAVEEAQAAQEQAQRNEEATREQAEREEAAAREREEAAPAAETAEESSGDSLTDRMLVALIAQQQEAAARERAASARRAKEFFAKLGEAAEAEEIGTTTRDAALELADNPFKKSLTEVVDGPLGELGGDLGRATDGKLLDKGLDVASRGPGRAEHDPAYDELAEGVDAARGQALGADPFAKESSGQALSGVQHMHRKALGATTELARQIDEVGRDAPTGAAGSNPFRPSRPPASPSGGSAATEDDLTGGTDNPFARPAGSQQMAALAPDDGEAGSSGSLATLGKGQVRRLQEQLGAAGFDPGSADGVAGRRTVAALRALQEARGLEPTGKPDRATLSALGIR
jgi:hypothetical protein